MFTITLEIEFDAENAAEAVAMFVDVVKNDYPLCFQVKDTDGRPSVFQRESL